MGTVNLSAVTARTLVRDALPDLMSCPNEVSLIRVCREILAVANYAPSATISLDLTFVVWLISRSKFSQEHPT